MSDNCTCDYKKRLFTMTDVCQYCLSRVQETPIIAEVEKRMLLHNYILEGKEVRPAKSYEEMQAFYRDNKGCIGEWRSPDNEVRVSTIFLPVRVSLTPDEKIQFFETVIFGGKFHLKCRRYFTYDEAKAGHDETVWALTDGVEKKC